MAGAGDNIHRRVTAGMEIGVGSTRGVAGYGSGIGSRQCLAITSWWWGSKMSSWGSSSGSGSCRMLDCGCSLCVQALDTVSASCLLKGVSAGTLMHSLVLFERPADGGCCMESQKLWRTSGLSSLDPRVLNPLHICTEGLSGALDIGYGTRFPVCTGVRGVAPPLGLG